MIGLAVKRIDADTWDIGDIRPDVFKFASCTEKALSVPELHGVECAAKAVSNLRKHALRGSARAELDSDYVIGRTRAY